MADYARGELLRELRDQTHNSREFVAAEIGVTAKTLYTWEHGGKIKWDNAKKLATYYKVDPETLVSRDDDAEEPSEVTPILNGHVDLHTLNSKLDRILALLEEGGATQTTAADPHPQPQGTLGRAARTQQPKSPDRKQARKGKGAGRRQAGA
jgi:transcriptional regulator with XRE-family HTH domain